MDQATTAQKGTERRTIVEFNKLKEPGSYITEQGSLVRVEPEALIEGHSPTIKVFSRDNTHLTKISPDWKLPFQQARLLAKDMGLKVHF